MSERTTVTYNADLDAYVAPAGATVKAHKFELAGLGVAPFRCIGHYEILHVVPGLPARAGGSCDFCSACIRDAFTIQGADGRTFKVGSDCVLKTGDAGLRAYVDEVKTKARQMKAKAKRDAALVRKQARFAAARGALPALAEKLASQPHPSVPGLTLLDYVSWLLDRWVDKGATIVEGLART